MKINFLDSYIEITFPRPVYGCGGTFYSAINQEKNIPNKALLRRDFIKGWVPKILA